MRTALELGVTEREDELFGRWSASRKGLIRDGVVDERAYLASNPRIMLVLKDVNDKKNDGWDLQKRFTMPFVGTPGRTSWMATRSSDLAS